MSQNTGFFPVTSNEIGFNRYLQEIRKFPSLEAEEEYILAKNYNEQQNMGAAHKLVTSHLKLVAKVATTFRGYGFPMIELISEGNIGLMQAVKKFDPDLGFRLSTYAIWWIKAAIQEYILKSWSLVKIGTTAAQKKLFFNLGKIKKKLRNIESRNLSNNDISTIATELNVSEKTVSEMNTRLSSDISLNNLISQDSDEELISSIREPKANQEESLAISQDIARKRYLFQKAMTNVLDDRQRDIVYERNLKEPSATLEDLSQKYNISRERIRQIESKAIEKLQKAVIHFAETE